MFAYIRENTPLQSSTLLWFTHNRILEVYFFFFLLFVNGIIWNDLLICFFIITWTLNTYSILLRHRNVLLYMPHATYEKNLQFFFSFVEIATVAWPIYRFNTIECYAINNMRFIFFFSFFDFFDWISQIYTNQMVSISIHFLHIV